MTPDELFRYRNNFLDVEHVPSTLELWGTPDTPHFSIMIPTFRRPALLREALLSAVRQAAAVPFEVVVVNNDPADDGAVRSVCESVGAPAVWLYRNHRNVGMFGNWNKCLLLARGEWLTILNDDDTVDAGFLAAWRAAVTARPGTTLFAASHRIRDDRQGKRPAVQRMAAAGRRLLARRRELRPLTLLDYFLRNPHQGSLGVAFTRQAALATGGFRADLYPSADYLFFTRLVADHPAVLCERTLATYRVAVNESTAPEVSSKWVGQGLAIRREIACRLGLPPRLAESYAQRMATQTARGCRDFWKADIDVEELCRQNGVRSSGSVLTLLLLRWLIARTGPWLAPSLPPDGAARLT